MSQNSEDFLAELKRESKSEVDDEVGQVENEAEKAENEALDAGSSEK